MNDMPSRYLVSCVRIGEHNLQRPAHATAGAAGLDLSAVGEHTLMPGQRTLVPTGFAIHFPPGVAGFIWPRSGLATRHGLDVLAGLIDQDYTGEIKVALINLGDQPITLQHGERVAQIVLQGYVPTTLGEVDPVELPATERGAGGFGSTGAMGLH